MANLASSSEENERSHNQRRERRSEGSRFSAKTASRMKTTPTVAGNNCAGMIELDIERERADRQQDERNVRIHQAVEDVLLQRHVESADRLADEVRA